MGSLFKICLRKVMIWLLVWVALPNFHLFAEKPPKVLRALTFNVMVDLALDSWIMEGIPLWFARKKNVFVFLDELKPDLIAMQEPLFYQVNGIVKNFPDLEVVRHPYFTDSVLFYSKQRFSLIKKGMFWLSARPQVEYSTDFGNPWPRICVWADLQDREAQKILRVFAVHFDARRKARAKMVDVLAKEISSMNHQDPQFVIAMGDFNINITDSEYDQFLNYFGGSIVSAQPIKTKDDFFPVSRADVIPTYRKRQIDHIFISSKKNNEPWKVVDWQIRPTIINQMPISDHQAVYADLEFIDKIPLNHQKKPSRHEP